MSYSEHRTIEVKCEVCDEHVPLETPEEMLVYRVGHESAIEPMRSGPVFDEKVTGECSEGHVVGALLISGERDNLPEPLESQKQQIEIEERKERNRGLDEF